MDKFKLSSGFTISVKPLSPYYMDFIEDVFRFPEFPKRKIKLTSGEFIDYEYTPPKVPPTDAGEEFDLYLKYKAVETSISKIEILRERARRDFLLSTCVTIEEGGPIDYNSEEWTYKVEAAFPNYTVPKHEGKRKLVFLKAIAITSVEETELIIQRCLHQEVNMQSIIDALQGFRTKMA
jgi:hypothetical protein